MQGASKRLVTLFLLVIVAVFVAVPATALAKPTPPKYVLVSHTKGALVTLNTKTGKLTFKPEKSHFGIFRVVVKHGTKKMTYRFTVTRPKGKSKRPVVTVIKSPGAIPPIIIITVTVSPIVPVGGPSGPPVPIPSVPPPPLPLPPPVQGTPPPSLITPPIIHGVPMFGNTLTTTPGTWSNSTTQDGVWDRCNVEGGCSQIATPPGYTYVVDGSDENDYIIAVETAVGPGGSTTVISAPTDNVGIGIPATPDLGPYPVVESPIAAPAGLKGISTDPNVDCLQALSVVGSAIAPESVCSLFELGQPNTPTGSIPEIDRFFLCEDYDQIANFQSSGKAPEWYYDDETGNCSIRKTNGDWVFAFSENYAVPNALFDLHQRIVPDPFAVNVFIYILAGYGAPVPVTG